jgi:hypothetical protein
VKVACRVFMSTAIFALVLAVGYWVVAHEPAGTTLLLAMAIVLAIVAVYLRFPERDARLWGDDPSATPRDAAGERVGTYVLHSPVPFWCGIALTAVALGLVVTPAAAGVGIIALCFLGCLAIVRSR